MLTEPSSTVRPEGSHRLTRGLPSYAGWAPGIQSNALACRFPRTDTPPTVTMIADLRSNAVGHLPWASSFAHSLIRPGSVMESQPINLRRRRASGDWQTAQDTRSRLGSILDQVHPEDDPVPLPRNALHAGALHRQPFPTPSSCRRYRLQKHLVRGLGSAGLFTGHERVVGG